MTARQSAMSDNNKTPKDPNRDLLCAVLDDGKIALVRVVGRGSFANSMALKRFAAHMQSQNKNFRFIVDLDLCESMDSTFMGVIAGIAITQIRAGGPRVTVVNPSQQCHKLLKNLGLEHLVDLRTGPVNEVGRAEFRPAEATPASRAEQICLTLQAHKQLVDIDQKNEVRFQAVIEYLEKSLSEEERGACDNPEESA